MKLHIDIDEDDHLAIDAAAMIARNMLADFRGRPPNSPVGFVLPVRFYSSIYSRSGHAWWTKGGNLSVCVDREVRR